MAFAGAPFADTQINTTTAGEQEHPAIAGLSGGGHVVAWASTSGQDGSGSGVYAQILDADGQPVGLEFRVNTTTADAQDFPDVAALTNGDFVVVWVSANQDGSFDGIYMQRYSATGAALGVETLVNTETQNSQGEVQVTALSSGGYAVAWADFNDPASVRMQIFDAAGLAQGAEITVATLPQDHFAWQVDVTELASGRLAVVWADAANGAAADDPYFQLVRSNGNLVGGPVQMNTTPGTHATQTQVAALPGGGFLAVWAESIGATGAVGVGDARIVGRLYDNAGVALTGEFTISNGTTGLRYDPQVTVGGDGNVYVGWLEQTGNGEVYVMRAVDETGALQGDEFYISDMTPLSTLNRFLDLTTLDNGDVMATWGSWFGTMGVVTRLIHTDRDDARVTGGADVVTLAAGGDLLDGLGGNDAITGAGGDDTVFGNGGADTLLGLSGRDFLKGGAGGDSLDGGTEADTLMGGDGADTLDGLGGDDVLIGEDQADVVNGGNGNDTIQGGAGSDVLSGNADNDSIWGDHEPSKVWTDGAGAADTLYGGSGDDKLYGGSGEDVLEGGEGDDVLFGDDYSYDGLETGNDRLILSLGDDTLNGLAGEDTVDATGATVAIKIELDPFTTGMGMIYSTGNLYSGAIYQAEHVWAGGFDDTLVGNALANGLVGNGGNDSLTGGEGDDTLEGNADADVLAGEGGRDLVLGGNGNDTLTGAGNNDTLDGGTGRDSLDGGAGEDQFVFGLGYGKDTVAGYVQGQDQLSLDPGLWGGGLSAAQVVTSFATLSGNGKKVTFDFGGADILVLKGSGFDLGTLADDLLI